MRQACNVHFKKATVSLVYWNYSPNFILNIKQQHFIRRVIVRCSAIMIVIIPFFVLECGEELVNMKALLSVP